MIRRSAFLYRFGTIAALVLALFMRDAEGLTYLDQDERPQRATALALSPNPYQVVLDLSGEWQLKRDADDPGQRAWLPGCYPDAQTAVEFRRDFTLPDSLRTWNLQIHLPEIHYGVELWLNGRFVSSFTGSHLGFSSDLSRDHVRFGGSNELILKVDNSLSADQTLPVYSQLMHPLNYGGLFAGVFLRAVPAWSIEDLSFAETLGRDSAQVNGTVSVRIARYSQVAATGDSALGSQAMRAVVMLTDSLGVQLSEGRSEVLGQSAGDRFQVAVGLPLFRPQFWSPDAPALYVLSAFLVAGGDTIHEFSQRIGFKRVRLEHERLYLNNTLFKIRAVDYVVEAANGGRAVADSRIARDFEAMKELGINSIRVRHNAPPRNLVHLADEKGFLLFVEAGLDRVPGEICGRARFRNIVEHTYEHLLAQFSDHVSILAWNIGTQLDFSHPATTTLVSWLRHYVRERDGRPCFVERLTGGPANSEAELEFVYEDLDLASEASVDKRTPQTPEVGSDRVRIQSFGKRAAQGETPISEQSAGLVNQAEALIRRVTQIDGDASAAGFCIHSFADYHGASPLLSQPIPSDPLIYTYGLVNYHRQERIAYFKLRDLAQTGQASPPIPVDTPEEPPLAFPVAGLAALVLLSIEMRRNNVFSQNLKRVFLHAHGFYSDLRYRRFLHTTQPLLLWFLESVTLAVLVASSLYGLRFSRHFDYVLSHFMPWPGAKADLIALIWSPPRSVIYFTLAFAGLILVLTALVRLFSIPFREKVDFWQSANYVIWALAALLFLLPVSVVFYRMLNSAQFKQGAVVLVGAAAAWCVIRLLNAMRTGLGISAVRAYGIVLTLVLALGGAAAFLLTNSRQTFAYLSYFQRVFGGN